MKIFTNIIRSIWQWKSNKTFVLFQMGYLVFEIRKNLDLRKILVAPKIFLKSRFQVLFKWPWSKYFTFNMHLTLNLRQIPIWSSPCFLLCIKYIQLPRHSSLNQITYLLAFLKNKPHIFYFYSCSKLSFIPEINR